MQAYPTCGYGHRVIDAAIELQRQLQSDSKSICKMQISGPDYYLDILIYAAPENSADLTDNMI